MTDPIADMLTRIRNAARVAKEEVAVPYSRVKYDIAKILEREGYVSGVSSDDAKRTLHLKIALNGNVPVVRDLTRLSKPGRRLYVGWQEIPRVMSGLGITILSTSQGMMVGAEARRRKLGGELVCSVY